jgi:hypothetical protein
LVAAQIPEGDIGTERVPSSFCAMPATHDTGHMTQAQRAASGRCALS